MLHTKYQGFTPCGFWQEEFLRFSYITFCKTDQPPNEAFYPRGIIWTILEEDY